MKDFSLEKAMKTRIAKDEICIVWRLSSVDVSSQLMFWAAGGKRLRTGFDGEIVDLTVSGFLYTTEVEEE